jgi:hypothetical protein
MFILLINEDQKRGWGRKTVEERRERREERGE